MPLPPRLHPQLDSSSIYIEQAGDYCMRDDLHVGRLWDWHAMTEKGGAGEAAINIYSSGTRLDLGTHRVKADKGGVGGVGTAMRDYKDSAGKTGLLVTNGEVRSRTGFGVLLTRVPGPLYSVPSDVEDFYGSTAADLTGFALGQLAAEVEANRKGMRETRHEVSNLKIVAGQAADKRGDRFNNIGVGIVGAANVVRGNTIVVTDPYAGIYLVGPNQVVEDNVIILKGDAAAGSSAAIKLHLAHGSVIRNNKIILQGFTPPVDRAIVLIESKDVIVEGNLIYGVERTVKLWDAQSSAIERGNKTEGVSLFH